MNQNEGDLLEKEDIHNRRTFVKVALGGVGLCWVGAIGYPIYKYLASPVEKAMEASAITEVNLKDAQKLEVGSALMFKFGSIPALLIHHKNGQWVAFDAVCTHLGCTVQYEADMDRIHCACHGGVYNAYTGANVSGPPPKPLAVYKVEVLPSEVKVSRA
jgi:cytochrome b6-f complex iron-sulfur subunit